MNSHDNANINVIEVDTYEDMMRHVAQVTMASGMSTTAGTLYRQGNRWCFQTALDLNALPQMTAARRVKPGDGAITSINDVRHGTNRPLDTGHANAIAKYVADAINNDRKYILPSVTLNFDQPVNVYAVKSTASARAAVLAMPLGVRMEITDGQHRIEGVKRALEKLNRNEISAIGAMITFTDETAQVHQDFADCAKTKALSASLLAAYDMRNPANGLTMDLISENPVFRFTVDSVKQSVSARSHAVWTTNQIRVMLKWALQGSQSSDDVFASNALLALGERGAPEYRGFLDALSETLSIFCEYNPTMRKLAELTRETLSDIPRIRESDNSLLMTGSGLAVFGYIWNKLRSMQRTNPQLDSRRIMQRAAMLDWSISTKVDPATGDLLCANPLFRDNLKKNPERTQSGQKYVALAGDAVWEEITREEALAA
jgi:DGQHR domain-containing protein